MPVITVEMVREMNQRLAGKNAPHTIAEKEYPNGEYDKNLIAETVASTVAPLIIDEISYTNCSNVEQSVTMAVDKTVANEVSWSLKFGTTFKMTLEFEAKMLFVNAKTGFEFEMNMEAGREGKDSEEVAYKFEMPIKVGPMKRVLCQAIVQQEKVKDVPFKLFLFLKGGQVSVVPNGLARLRRYYDGKDHFYTIHEEHPEDNGHKEEDSPGYIFNYQAPDTELLFRYWNGTDHFYAFYEEIGEGAHNWKKEGIAGWVYRHERPNTVPLYRYWNGTDHFYTTNYSELGERRHGYVKEGIACYIVPASVAEGGAPRDILELLPSLEERTFELRGTFQGESTVRQTNVLMVESPATVEECKILAGGLGASGLPKGVHEERTAASELASRTPLTPEKPGVKKLRELAGKPLTGLRLPRRGR